MESVPSNKQETSSKSSIVLQLACSIDLEWKISSEETLKILYLLMEGWMKSSKSMSKSTIAKELGLRIPMSIRERLMHISLSSSDSHTKSSRAWQKENTILQEFFKTCKMHTTFHLHIENLQPMNSLTLLKRTQVPLQLTLTSYICSFWLLKNSSKH